MDVSLSNGSRNSWLLPLTLPELGRALKGMAGAMQTDTPLVLVELTLCDDDGIAELNQDFLGLPGPTNVLAFPGMGGLGSLALSVETICREAWLYGQEPAAYTLKMLAHGLAHLMGYDHGPEMDIVVEKGLAAAIN